MEFKLFTHATDALSSRPWNDQPVPNGLAERAIEYREYAEVGQAYDEYREGYDADFEYRYADFPLALTATGIAVGAAAAVLSVFAAPLTPVTLASAGLGLASGTAIPGAVRLLDWRDGKRTAYENGLHYLSKT